MALQAATGNRVKTDAAENADDVWIVGVSVSIPGRPGRRGFVFSKRKKCCMALHHVASGCMALHESDRARGAYWSPLPRTPWERVRVRVTVES
jgi:hypothetical protein